MNKLDELLFEHNMYPGYKGYEYVRHIITLDEPISLISMMSLYKAEAYRFNTSPEIIERNIRNLKLKSNIGKMPNKKFLAMLQVEYKGVMLDES